MSYVRAILIGLTIGLFLVLAFMIGGCKDCRHDGNTVIENPPPPEPCEATITCSDGAGFVTISGSVCDGITTLESGSGKDKVVLQEGDFLFRQRTCLGVHVYTLRDNDGIVLAQCVIDTDADPKSEDVGCIIKPEPKVLMCHEGTEIKVDKATVMDHLIAGDTLGACPPPVVECVDGPFESVETQEQE